MMVLSAARVMTSLKKDSKLAEGEPSVATLNTTVATGAELLTHAPKELVTVA